MLEIDLLARTVSSSLRVWRLFPGSSYKFLDDFIEHNIGYLDFPGLDLPADKIDEGEDLMPRIVMSHAIRAGQPNDEEHREQPSLDQFMDARVTANRSRLRSALLNFYDMANAGDLVVLPTPLSDRNVWLGEISSNEVAYFKYYKTTIDANVPTRHIKWVRSVKENSLSSALSKSLRNQYPFNLIERSLYREVFALLYSSYVEGDIHCSTIQNGHDFMDVDSHFSG